MLTLTVHRLKDGKSTYVKSSSRQALLDHLEASAGRNGFDVYWFEPREFGGIRKDGVTVATWEVSNA